MDFSVFEKEVTYERKSAWEDCADDALTYAEGYKKYITAAKTERECVQETVSCIKKYGFTDLKDQIRAKEKIKSGQKLYYVYQNKCVVMFIIGTDPIENGMNITASHLDAPRLDLKAVPLYEEANLSLMKTHYYGGIKKYQWTATPLSMHGVVFTKNGTKHDISIGERDDEPVFFISELLVHLSAEQMDKKASKAVTGEQLNVIVGNIPFGDADVSQKIKLNTLRLLYEKYGITEEDFISAEIEIVPAMKPRDAGLDASMIAGYGHDDRVCAYAAFTALAEHDSAKRTCVCILCDKEEIGSVGSTGLEGLFFENIVSEVLNLCSDTYNELNLKRTLANSYVLSMDVSCVFDPSYPDAFEKQNTAVAGCGVVLEKYSGARGKAGSNDAHSEYLYKLRMLFNDSGVIFQTGEMGKIDAGGSGTVAYMLAKYGAHTVDLGVGVLSMHAPCELISKADLYSAYRAAGAFYTIAE